MGRACAVAATSRDLCLRGEVVGKGFAVDLGDLDSPAAGYRSHALRFTCVVDDLDTPHG